MLILLLKLFSLRRSIGLGVVVATLLAISHYVPALAPNTTMRNESVQTEQPAGNGLQVVSMPQESSDGKITKSVVSDGDSGGKMTKDEFFKNLEMDEEGFNWRKDWWKYLCIVLVGLLVVVCGIRLTKMMFRLVIFLVCMVTGILGSFYIGPLVTPVLQPHIPEQVLKYVNPELVGYVAGFVLAYLIITIVIALLPRAVHGGGPKKK